MQEAKRRIPHFALVEEFDVTALEETRAMMNRDRGANPKLTLLPFLITAMARAVGDWPMLNATFDDDANVVTRHGAVHMGVATQTDGGLMVPVIRNAQNHERVAAGARNPPPQRCRAQRQGQPRGADRPDHHHLVASARWAASPRPRSSIRPEVATIAVNKVREMPVIVDGELEARKLMNLSLSCDHRVVDGWDAANFMQAMKALIENPIRLLSV